jgi:uncharacterized protein YjdB
MEKILAILCATGVFGGTARAQWLVVSEVSVSPRRSTLAVGEDRQLVAKAFDQFGDEMSDVVYSWESEDPEHVAVDGSGLIHALGEPPAPVYILITANGEGTPVDVRSVLAIVAVSNEPLSVTAVRLNGKIIPVRVGQQVHLAGAVLDQFFNDMPGIGLQWTSADEGIAQVDESGVVTGVAKGSTTMTAQAEGSKASSYLRVEVNDANPVATELRVRPNAVMIPRARPLQLVATVYDQYGQTMSDVNVGWDAADLGVLNLDETGQITGGQYGSTYVVAYGLENDALYGTATVHVVPTLDEVRLSPESALAYPGQHKQFVARAFDEDGTLITADPASFALSSSDEEVAVVVGQEVLALKVGSAIITASIIGASISGNATLQVSDAEPIATQISMLSATVSVGGAEQVVAVAFDQYGEAMADAAFAWSSSDTAICTVDSNGIATGIAAGVAQVTAAIGEVSGSAEVTVISTEQIEPSKPESSNSSGCGCATHPGISGTALMAGILAFALRRRRVFQE